MIRTTGGGPARRASDPGPVLSLLLRPGSSRAWTAVAGGRVLLLSAGVIVLGTAPLLRPERHAWVALLLISTGMVGALLVSLVLPWSRLPRVGTVAFPLLVWSALAALGTAGDGLGAPYGGLFVLCFAYTGLTQRASTSLWLVPPALLAYTATMGTWSTSLAIRLLIVTLVWVLLSQVLAEQTARQQALTEALRSVAHTDALTGLANRRDLDLRLAEATADDCLVLCDLDHFKRFNDTLGHAAGDAVLADFGLLLRTSLRRQDYAARYGGEEFTLLLRSTTVAEGRAVLERLHERWAEMAPDITFSSGRATCVPGQLGTTVENADRALYAAKAAGRSCDRSSPDLGTTGEVRARDTSTVPVL